MHSLLARAVGSGRRHTKVTLVVSLLLVVNLALVSAVLAKSSAPTVDPGAPEIVDDLPPRVVVIGDIHGAFDSLVSILLSSGLIDQQHQWIGGDSVLVQTGDFLDRGAGAWAAAELLRNLQPEAASAGGRVMVLLGNHEILNLVRDFRDVTAEIVAPFAHVNSGERQSSYCQELYGRAKRHARKRREPPPEKETFLKGCVEDFPAGWLEYLDALEPKAPLGEWLRSLPTVVRLGPWLFVHGGISQATSTIGIEAINRQVREEIETFDSVRRSLLKRGTIVPTAGLTEIRKAASHIDDLSVQQPGEVDRKLRRGVFSFRTLGEWLLFNPEGPVWFRGYARWSEIEGKARVPAIFANLGVQHAAVGHTPRKSGRIEARFDDSIYLLDTGMLTEIYGGQASALEIVGDEITALYVDDRQRLSPVLVTE